MDKQSQLHAGVATDAAVTSSVAAAEFLDAFERMEAEVRAVPEDDLMVVNLDVPTVISTVMGALPKIAALRGELVKLPGFDVARFDKLRDYTLALAHTHGGYRTAQGPADPIGKLSEEVVALREQLYTDALALAKRGLLDEGRVSRSRSGVGYRNTAFDVVSLIQLLRDDWSKVSSKTAVTEKDLEHAGEVAQQLVIAVGSREQSPPTLVGAILLRQQAFTLFVKAYDDVRRGVSYLRWQTSDVDSIAPSIWAGRRKSKVTEETHEEVPEKTGDASTTAVTTPTNAVTAPTSAVTTPTSAPKAAVGMPGPGPFSS